MGASETRRGEAQTHCSVSWVIHYEDAYDHWDSTTDIEDDSDIRLAVLAYLISWKEHGPPPEATHEVELDTLSCFVPGTPVTVEYVVWRGVTPRAVFVVALHS